MLPVFTACINEILENLPPFGQDLCQIWYHQCTVMTDVVDGFYKKTPTPVMFAFYNFLSFTIASMSADSELQKLVREFEQEGLPHLFIHPPASAPHEETPPVPTQPIQTRSTRKKFKLEVRSKRNEDRHRQSGKTPEDSEMNPSSSA